MVIITHTRKSIIKKMQLFLVVFLIFVTVSSCSVVNQTTIQNIADTNTTWAAHHDSIYVLCSIYYLRHFDTIAQSKKSPFKSDLLVAKKIVSDALSSLYSADSSILKKFVLCTSPNQISSYKYIDVQVHVFINLWGLIPIAKVRESVCIKSSIVANESIIKSHEEWGYRRTLGEFYDLGDGYGECEEND
jgi:hypothetical protein